MAYNFHGKVIAIGERYNGESKNGPYAIDNFMVEEMLTQYPRKVNFKVFSNASNPSWKMMGVKVGEEVTVRFDIDAHESNGRWFNDVKAFAVERGNSVLAPSDNEPVKSIVQQLSENEQVQKLQQAGMEIKQDKLPF